MLINHIVCSNKTNRLSVKAYFHYGCALRGVALRDERNRNTIGVSIVSLAVQRNT